MVHSDENDHDGRTQQRPLAMWSAPRALSHAVEKMMRARGDHVVFSEPFNDCWYYGPERQTHRSFASLMPSMTYGSQLAAILEASRTARVFVRAQPWQFGDKYLNMDMLTRFRSTILLRDPAYSLPSLHKLKPDFTEWEAGYTALHTAWNMLRAGGEATPIVDSMDIQRDPINVVRAWCDANGLARNDGALSWQKGSDESWNSWRQYTDTVTQSTGFMKAPQQLPEVKDERVARMIDAARVLYREMESHKITATDVSG